MADRDERIHQQRELRVARRLAASGMPIEQATLLLAMWRDEAYKRGISRFSPAYWRESVAWIAEMAAQGVGLRFPSPHAEAELDLRVLLEAVGAVAAADRAASTAAGRAADPQWARHLHDAIGRAAAVADGALARQDARRARDEAAGLARAEAREQGRAYLARLDAEAGPVPPEVADEVDALPRPAVDAVSAARGSLAAWARPGTDEARARVREEDAAREGQVPDADALVEEPEADSDPAERPRLARLLRKPSVLDAAPEGSAPTAPLAGLYGDPADYLEGERASWEDDAEPEGGEP